MIVGNINHTDTKASEVHAVSTFRVKVITVRMQPGYKLSDLQSGKCSA
jgi:hypothetical protein